MKHYVLHTAQGVIRRAVSLRDGDPAPSVIGLTTIETPSRIDPMMNHVEAGQIVAGVLDTRDAARKVEDQWKVIRDKQFRRLESSDRKVIRHLEVGDAVPLPLRQYRQALREVTSQTDPFNIVWPVEP